MFAGIGFDPAVAARMRRKEPAPVPVVQEPPAAPPVVAEAPPAPPPQPSQPVQAPPPAPPEPPAIAPPKPPEAPHVERTVRDGHLALLAQVQFAHDKATILPVSAPLLAEVAAVLRESPEIRKVRVEGHTDNHGKPAYNRRLSQRRAESVLRYLVGAGIARSRLLAKGFGADHPIVPNDTAGNRAKNRRVEFVVLDGPKPR
jgi:outer membrane protein OmpA-like peptidoglycan-associated protein